MTEIVVAPEGAVATLTPMALIQQAVAGGADIDKLKQLMDLQERWEANEAKKAFVVALAAFKANPPIIMKNKQVRFTTSKGVTEYKHALSGESAEKIGAALAEHGLSHRWDVTQGDGGRVEVTCILTHVLGHSERTTLKASPDDSGGKNGIQAIGSTVSYLQRYTLFAASGLVPKDADDDGAQGASSRGMDERVIEDFRKQIAELSDRKHAEALWQSIAAACTKAGDVPAYNDLKAAVAARVKVVEAKQ